MTPDFFQGCLRKEAFNFSCFDSKNVEEHSRENGFSKIIIAVFVIFLADFDSDKWDKVHLFIIIDNSLGDYMDQELSVFVLDIFGVVLHFLLKLLVTHFYHGFCVFFLSLNIDGVLSIDPEDLCFIVQNRFFVIFL